MDRIEQIRAAHLAARPKPAVNPAWANAEHDIGVLLAEIARLREALETIQEFAKATRPDPQANVPAILHLAETAPSGGQP